MKFPVALVLAAAALACDAEPSPPEQLDITCQGKCDGLDSVIDMMRDPSELAIDDLLNASVPVVVDELNDFLSSSRFVDIKLAEPAFHHEDDIDALVTGLAARYGESELTTEVNRVRAEHLSRSDDTTYAEVAVSIRGELANDWNFAAEGFDEVTTLLGFNVGTTLEGRVIGAYPFEPGDPMNNLKALRGFVVPRSMEELGAMKPGEVIAVRGAGRLGLNVGLGVPLLVADPTAFLTYSIALTAALRTQLEGTLDIQLVRLDGSELVLDVGIDRARIKSARLGVEDRWGVQGLLDTEVEIAGIEVDLGRLAEKALQRSLNDQLDLISAHAERSTTKTRASVVRFRFDLAKADPDRLGKALRHAFVGDIRLAQALANRGEPGIRSEFDLLRSGVSTTSSAGIDIFGLRFFKERIEKEGTIVAQTPGGARSLMFDSLHVEGGLFTSSHGFTRVGLAGLSWDAAGGTPRSEANLFVQVQEGDRGMERDKYVDHLDALIVAVAGADAYAAIDAPANELERFTQSLCPGARIADACTWDSTQNPELRTRRDAALMEFESAIAGVDGKTFDLLKVAATHKLLAQGTYEVKGNGFIGPGTDVFVDFRLDDATLADLALQHDGEDLAAAIEDILAATDVRRDLPIDELEAERRALRDNVSRELGTIADTFDAFAASYRQLLDAEAATLDTVGELGPRTLEIRFSLDASNRPRYEEAVVRSLAQARSKLATQLFDSLHEQAGEWEPHAEQVVAYGLLALAAEERLDLRLDVDHFLKDTVVAMRKVYRRAGYPEHFSAYARGPANAPIGGGLFDVDALLEAER
jgi:hypothetical protein